MGQAGRRWVFRVGVLITAGELVGQAEMAAASPAAQPRAAVPARTAGSTSAGASVRASAQAYVPPGQLLSLGMHGTAVRNLQTRLAALKYYPGKIDGQFGLDTLEAVWAFKEVQGLPINFANQDVVSRSTHRPLVPPPPPHVPLPRVARPRRQ